MYISHLPEGPTSFFKLTNVKLAQEMRGSAALTTHSPEVVLNNFTTRLGRRAARQLAALFPQVSSACTIIDHSFDYRFHNAALSFHQSLQEDGQESAARRLLKPFLDHATAISLFVLSAQSFRADGL